MKSLFLSRFLVVLCCASTAAFGANAASSGNSANAGNSANPGNGASSTPAAAPAAASAPAFELPRFHANSDPSAKGQIPKAHATVDGLADRGAKGVAKSHKQDLDYVAVDAGSSWSSPLHAGGDRTFVSFFVYGSVGTVIDAGGAKIMLRPGTKPDYAQMYVGTPAATATHWRTFGGPVKFEKFDGKPLAPLPILTLRLDPIANVWDVFVGSRLAVAGLAMPPQPSGAPLRFSISAGANGARLLGLVSSQDNPLYEDANANGIDDAFERQQNGGALLSADAASADREKIAAAWVKDQTQHNVRPWPVRRLRPDGAPTTPPGKGK